MLEIEVQKIDLRFEGLRLKDRNLEEALFLSILTQGIREPLLCLVRSDAEYILLDGFKRLRCAKKMGLASVVVSSIGDTESAAILQLLRISNSRKLDILEQAALVDELQKTQTMSISEIGRQLERSPAWVSLRVGLIDGMSPVIRQAIFGGRFPVRAYMYTLRPFTRVKGKKALCEAEAFVSAVAGKELSVRAIAFLWKSYSGAGPELKNQLLKGDLDWTMEQLKKQAGQDETGLSAPEMKLLKDLDWVKKYMHKIPYELNDKKTSGLPFLKKAELLIAGIQAGMNLFIKSLEDFLCSHKTGQRP